MRPAPVAFFFSSLHVMPRTPMVLQGIELHARDKKSGLL